MKPMLMPTGEIKDEPTGLKCHCGGDIVTRTRKYLDPHKRTPMIGGSGSSFKTEEVKQTGCTSCGALYDLNFFQIKRKE